MQEVNAPEKYELNFSKWVQDSCLLWSFTKSKNTGKNNLHVFKWEGTDNSSQTRDIKTGDFFKQEQRIDKHTETEFKLLWFCSMQIDVYVTSLIAQVGHSPQSLTALCSARWPCSDSTLVRVTLVTICAPLSERQMACMYNECVGVLEMFPRLN